MQITLVRNGREHEVRLGPDWLNVARATVTQMRTLPPPPPFRSHSQAIIASIAAILDGHYPDPDRKLLASHVAGWVVATNASEGVYLVIGKPPQDRVEITPVPEPGRPAESSNSS